MPRFQHRQLSAVANHIHFSNTDNGVPHQRADRHGRLERKRREVGCAFGRRDRQDLDGADAATGDHCFRSFRRPTAPTPEGTDKLAKDRDALLAFYDFPAEHWIHLRTTNPIESTFATVRHRTTRTKNCVSRSTFPGLAFKLIQEAEKSWRRIRGVERIAELLAGTVFRDGVPAPVDDPQQQRLAA